MLRNLYPLIKTSFQDKIGSINHSVGGGCLNIQLLTQMMLKNIQHED